MAATTTFPRSAAYRASAALWTRVSVGLLLGATFVLYMWGLDHNGWANAYYAAAVQAGTRSWKAFFFGSLDASNFITVDKSPAFLWVMEISARLFGFNHWSVLVPQALEGVATVAIVYIAVRRWFGPAAGLIAGAVVTLTPVAALMFRYNNPDALLVLLLTASAYATLRAVESARTRVATLWLVLAASLVGTAFLAKMLQAFVVVPVLILVYLLAGRPGLLHRIAQLAIAGATLIVASGWWVAAVELWPSADRPYIGGSQNNSLLNLIFGYNGFGRLTGNEAGSVGGFGVIGSRWGVTGWNRLFLDEFGGQISWLLPAAMVLLAAGLWISFRARRTDLARASFLMWGGTLVITGAVFSFAQGIVHPYYSIALAPSIGALVGAGSTQLWRLRAHSLSRLALGGALGVTAVWAYILLDRSPDWIPWLKVAIVATGLVAAVLIIAAPRLPLHITGAVAGMALIAALAGPGAYTLDTVAASHSGAIPSAGPVVTGAGPVPQGNRTGTRIGPPVGFQPPSGGGLPPLGPGGNGGAPGNFLSAGQVSAELHALLEANASHYRWVAATANANSAASYELATGEAVMAIGGFNGSDPAPTLEQFQEYVSKGQIHCYIVGGGGMRGGGGGSSGQIEAWVSQHYTPQTIGGVTIYDLTGPAV